MYNYLQKYPCCGVLSCIIVYMTVFVLQNYPGGLPPTQEDQSNTFGRGRGPSDQGEWAEGMAPGQRNGEGYSQVKAVV